MRVRTEVRSGLGVLGASGAAAAVSAAVSAAVFTGLLSGILSAHKLTGALNIGGVGYVVKWGLSVYVGLKPKVSLPLQVLCLYFDLINVAVQQVFGLKFGTLEELSQVLRNSEDVPHSRHD